MSKQEINDPVKVIEETVVIDKHKTIPFKIGITVNTNRAMFLDDPKLPNMIERLKKATAEFMHPNVLGVMLETTEKFKDRAEFSDKWFKPVHLDAGVELGPKTHYLHMHAILRTTAYCNVSVSADSRAKYRAVIKQHFMKYFPELKSIYVNIRTMASDEGMENYISKQAL